jgi:predicted phage-related endonuclease
MPDYKSHNNTYLGSHDIAALAGEHPFYKPMGVFMRKVGMSDQPVTPIMKMGLKMEPTILSLYEDDHPENKLKRNVHARVKGKDIFGSTIDALIDQDVINAGVDAKNVRFKSSKWGDPGTDNVPSYIFVGMQWHMLCHDLEQCFVAALFSGCDFEEYYVMRDQESIDMLTDIGEKFWKDHVITKTPPDLDGSDDAKRFLKERYPGEREGVRAATSEEIILIDAYGMAQTTFEKANLEFETCKNRLRKAIGIHTGLMSSRGIATWKKTKDKQEIDYKAAFNAAKPFLPTGQLSRILKQYTSLTGGHRRLLVRLNKNA